VANEKGCGIDVCWQNFVDSTVWYSCRSKTINKSEQIYLSMYVRGLGSDRNVFLFFFLWAHYLSLWQPSFPGMVKPIKKATICLFLEEVAVHSGNKVLMEVDLHFCWLLANSWGILGQQLMPRPSHLWIITLITFNNTFLNLGHHVFSHKDRETNRLSSNKLRPQEQQVTAKLSTAFSIIFLIRLNFKQKLPWLSENSFWDKKVLFIPKKRFYALITSMTAGQ